MSVLLSPPASGETALVQSLPQFVSKLWTIVNDAHTNDIISFNATGVAIEVKDTGRLAREVLPGYFASANWQTFVRQLNMYGFSKTGERGVTSYFHPAFVASRPHLLVDIERRSSNKKRTLERAMRRIARQSRDSLDEEDEEAIKRAAAAAVAEAKLAAKRAAPKGAGRPTAPTAAPPASLVTADPGTALYIHQLQEENERLRRGFHRAATAVPPAKAALGEMESSTLEVQRELNSVRAVNSQLAQYVRKLVSYLPYVGPEQPVDADELARVAAEARAVMGDCERTAPLSVATSPSDDGSFAMGAWTPTNDAGHSGASDDGLSETYSSSLSPSPDTDALPQTMYPPSSLELGDEMSFAAKSILPPSSLMHEDGLTAIDQFFDGAGLDGDDTHHVPQFQAMYLPRVSYPLGSLSNTGFLSALVFVLALVPFSSNAKPAIVGAVGLAVLFAWFLVRSTASLDGRRATLDGVPVVPVARRPVHRGDAARRVAAAHDAHYNSDSGTSPLAVLVVALVCSGLAAILVAAVPALGEFLCEDLLEGPVDLC